MRTWTSPDGFLEGTESMNSIFTYDERYPFHCRQRRIHRIRSHHSQAGPLSAPCGHGQDQWMGAPKTASYVTVCGIIHLLGTLLVGSLAIVLGLAFLNLETVQSLQADFAGWFLLCFGAVSFALRHPLGKTAREERWDEVP